MKKAILYSAVVALVVSLTSIGVFSYFTNQNNPRNIKIEHVSGVPSSAVYSLDESGNPVPLSFTETAEEVLDAVVHIKSTQAFSSNRNRAQQPQQLPDPFRDFFGDQFDQFFRQSPQSPRGPQPRVGSGSGVIINENGYIVTNNHVIVDADDIEVTLYDNRTYKATVIGTDPTTDIALIQIKEKGLPNLPFVNSDEVRIGEWVMAVGNPFSLNSTVTAGIVSAKGRSINILREQYAVEDFIQTDAAINPGNSGGALVNLNGGLIGINTAIASPTGAYSGYGFAVPSNIVSKVVEDLLQYGTVQRGVLGVMIRSVDGNLAKEKGLVLNKGVYVDSLLDNSAAAKAGVKSGDIITEVNGIAVETSPQLQGMIARNRPGETVKLTIDRSGKEKKIKVVLNNRQGNTELTSADQEEREILKTLGADFETIDRSLARKLDIQDGVKVTKLYAGKLRKYTDLREGFIITKVDGRKISSLEELIDLLEGKKGGVMLEGIYEDIPGEYYCAFGL